MDKKVIKPAPLSEGDKIVICSPSGIVKPQNVYGAVAVLQERGYAVEVSAHALGRCGTYSGTADERYADLEAALLDPTVKAIMSSRGGYGAVHLLARLDRLPLRENAKWLIGFSDISALHALMTRHGVMSIHGSMTSHLAKTEGLDDDSAALFDILSGREVGYDFPAHPFNRTGSAEGRLAGGNLSVIADLIGTPFNVIEGDTILFIEDVSEPVYKLERIFYQLRLSGVFDKLRGMIVGNFTEYSPDVDFSSVESMIHRLTKDYSFPIAFQAPIGHVSHNIPVVVGANARLSVTDTVVTLDF